MVSRWRGATGSRVASGFTPRQLTWGGITGLQALDIYQGRAFPVGPALSQRQVEVQPAVAVRSPRQPDKANQKCYGTRKRFLHKEPDAR